MTQAKQRRWMRPAELARKAGMSFQSIMRRIESGDIAADFSRRNKHGRPSGWRIPMREAKRFLAFDEGRAAA